MIAVTRLNGTEVVVNADLVETIEATPDTVITMVDGKQCAVRETTEEVVDKIRSFRAEILRRVDDPVVTVAAELYVLPARRAGHSPE